MPSGVYKRTAETRRKTSEANKGRVPWNKGKKGIYNAEARKKMGEAHKGTHISIETRAKMSEARKGKKLSAKQILCLAKLHGYNKGKHLSVEHRKKLSEANKGHVPWFKGRQHTAETRKKMSEVAKGRVSAYTGKHHSVETRKKISEAGKGRTHSPETKRKLSEVNKGSNCTFWRGGITPLVERIRSLFESKQWRSNIFHRDNWTCQECGKKGGELQVHHNKTSFSKIFNDFLIEYNQFSPIDDTETLVRLAIKWEPFWDLENGVTLCEDCHKLTCNYGRQKRIKETIVK